MNSEQNNALQYVQAREVQEVKHMPFEMHLLMDNVMNHDPDHRPIDQSMHLLVEGLALPKVGKSGEDEERRGRATQRPFEMHRFD